MAVIDPPLFINENSHTAILFIYVARRLTGKCWRKDFMRGLSYSKGLPKQSNHFSIKSQCEAVWYYYMQLTDEYIKPLGKLYSFPGILLQSSCRHRLNLQVKSYYTASHILQVTMGTLLGISGLGQGKTPAALPTRQCILICSTKRREILCKLLISGDQSSEPNSIHGWYVLCMNM